MASAARIIEPDFGIARPSLAEVVAISRRHDRSNRRPMGPAPSSGSAPAPPATNWNGDAPSVSWQCVYDAALGVSGAPVDSWTDIVASRVISAAGGIRPTFNASDPVVVGKPSITFARASAQVLNAAVGFSWTNNLTTTYYVRIVGYFSVWTSGAAFFGMGSNTVFCLTASPAFRMNAGASVNANSGFVAANTAKVVEAIFASTAGTDTLKIGSIDIHASDAGDGAVGTALGIGSIASGAAGSCLDCGVLRFGISAGVPTAGERTAMGNRDVADFGAGVLT